MEDLSSAIAIGSFVIALMGLVGGIIVRDRNISKRISDGDSKSHSRIDALKDDINDNFARKDDVRESVRRVEKSIDSLGQELRENHKSLTALLMDKRN